MNRLHILKPSLLTCGNITNMSLSNTVLYPYLITMCVHAVWWANIWCSYMLEMDFTYKCRMFVFLYYYCSLLTFSWWCLMFLSQAGPPWLSILTRTGVFRGEGNHFKFPADLVCINSLSCYSFAKIFVLDMIMTFNFLMTFLYTIYHSEFHVYYLYLCMVWCTRSLIQWVMQSIIYWQENFRERVIVSLRN